MTYNVFSGTLNLTQHQQLAIIVARDSAIKQNIERNSNVSFQPIHSPTTYTNWVMVLNHNHLDLLFWPRLRVFVRNLWTGFKLSVTDYMFWVVWRVKSLLRVHLRSEADRSQITLSHSIRLARLATKTEKPKTGHRRGQDFRWRMHS